MQKYKNTKNTLVPAMSTKKQNRAKHKKAKTFKIIKKGTCTPPS